MSIDEKTGGIGYMARPESPVPGEPSFRVLDGPVHWGTGFIRSKEWNGQFPTAQSVRQVSPSVVETTYQTPILKITVRRELQAQGDKPAPLLETYTFTNITDKPLSLQKDAVGLHLPIADRYTDDVKATLNSNFNVHLWAARNVAYIQANRMNAQAPFLGLIATEGDFGDGYSIVERPADSNIRGVFVLHPQLQLAPGASSSVSWKVFWNGGWDEFWAQTAQTPNFVRMEARDYSVIQGQPLQISARANQPLEGAQLLLNGEPVAARIEGKTLSATIPTKTLGDQTVVLRYGDGQQTVLRAWVTPEPLELIRRRVEFIIDKQQRHQPGDPTDGAYLIFDNETNRQFHEEIPYDHNAGRERFGMGVLLGEYVPFCTDAKLRERIKTSLRKYLQFVEREHQDPSGVVYTSIGRKGKRLYDYPWVMRLHLAAHIALGDKSHLQRFVDTARAYDREGGATNYGIAIPVTQGLEALEKAGMLRERTEVLALFEKHADAYIRNGLNYPAQEVKFEQSITGPAAQLLWEVYLVTKNEKYLEPARLQLRVTENFNGFQPDSRLNDMGIRHWDGHWFGKSKMWGDTFPHHWQGITAAVFETVAQVTGETAYRERAKRIVMNGLSMFTPDGRGGCAFLYPLTVNGKPGQFLDPFANDQDWMLVYYLDLLKAGAFSKTNPTQLVSATNSATVSGDSKKTGASASAEKQNGGRNLAVAGFAGAVLALVARAVLKR